MVLRFLSLYDILLKIQISGGGYLFGPARATLCDSPLESLSPGRGKGLSTGRGKGLLLRIPLGCCYHPQENGCLAGKASRCPLQHPLQSSFYLSSRSLTKMLNKTGLTRGARGSPPGIPLTMYIIIDNCSFALSQVLASVTSFTLLPV